MGLSGWVCVSLCVGGCHCGGGRHCVGGCGCAHRGVVRSALVSSALVSSGPLHAHSVTPPHPPPPLPYCDHQGLSFSHSARAAARFPMPHPILEALLPPSLEPGVCRERGGGGGGRERERAGETESNRERERASERERVAYPY